MNQTTGKIDISRAFSEGYNLFSKTAGMQILFAFIYFLAAMIIGMIPFLNYGFSYLAAPCLMMGYALMAHYYERSGRVEISSAFDGFKHFAGLVVVNLVVSLTVGIIFVAIVLPFMFAEATQLIALFTELGESASSGNPDQIMMIYEELGIVLLPFIPLLLIALFASMFVYNAFLFAPYYIVFGKKDIGAALSTSWRLGWKNMHILILFAILSGIILGVATILCLLPLLAAIPFVFLATYAMYRQLDPQQEDQEEILDEIIES